MSDLQPEPGTPVPEWIAASAGALMAIGIVSYMAWEGIGSWATPAQLAVHIDRIAPAGTGYRVDLSIVNAGDEAVADALVAGRSPTADDAEEGQITFDFVPGHSSRRGVLLFSEAPQPERLQLRVVGYREP